MAAVTRGNTDDVRRAALSPRPKGRGMSNGYVRKQTAIYAPLEYRKAAYELVICRDGKRYIMSKRDDIRPLPV